MLVNYGGGLTINWSDDEWTRLQNLKEAPRRVQHPHNGPQHHKDIGTLPEAHFTDPGSHFNWRDILRRLDRTGWKSRSSYRKLWERYSNRRYPCSWRF